MKRIFIFLLLLLFFIPSALAWETGGWGSGQFSASLIGTGYIGGGASDLPTETSAIPLNYGVIKKTMGGDTNQAGTMADGIQGQLVKIILEAKNGTGNYVLTPTTKTGFTSITFNSAGDQSTLLFVDNTIGWIIVGETGTSY